MTYFVGIDIAKYKHDCFVMDENGEVFKEPFSFDNDVIGFNTLLNVLNSIDSKHEKRIGFESTGHYGSNLKLFLERNGYSFQEYNPLLLNRHFKSETLRRCKTDKVDCQMISKYLFEKRDTYKPNPNSYYHLECLKSLCRLRTSLVDERSLQLVRITNVMDKMFPELKAFFGKQGFRASTALYILENYSCPSKISNMTKASYDKMKSELRRTIAYSKFIKIKEAAKNTIGNEDEILVFELKLYLELFKELDTKIQDIESKILSEFSEMKCHISTITGIGDITAAGILSEIGDFSKFSNPNQVLAYAGLEPSRSDSGTVTDSKGKMVKHGSPHLRRHLMTTAGNILAFNPVLYDYYHKKRNEGKSHTVALSHVAKRLVRIIFYLEKNDTDFNIEKMR